VGIGVYCVKTEGEKIKRCFGSVWAFVWDIVALAEEWRYEVPHGETCRDVTVACFSIYM
jgi:hypothetical protein